MKKRFLVPVIAVAMTLFCAIGGTLAWLTDKTEPVVNTFAVGNVDIALTETTGASYKMVPGNTIAKDPTVTVTANSEACWLFVKVDKSENFDDFMEYTMAAGWNALNGVDGVFCREVPESTAPQSFSVLKDDTVTVKDTVTKAQMDALTTADTYPALTFTAYAVQLNQDNDTPFTAAEAWDLVPAAP